MPSHDSDLACTLRVVLASLESRVADLCADQNVAQVQPAALTNSLLGAQKRIESMTIRLQQRGKKSSDIELSQVIPSGVQSVSERSAAPPERPPPIDTRRGTRDIIISAESEATHGGEYSGEYPNAYAFAIFVFKTFDDPTYSNLAFYMALVSLFLICVSIFMILLESDPWMWIHPSECAEKTKVLNSQWFQDAYFGGGEYNASEIKEYILDGQSVDIRKMCTPEPPGGFKTIEAACIVYFTAEYLARLFTAWALPSKSPHPETQEQNDKSIAPPQTPKEALVRIYVFICHPLNVIDVLAIMPYYVEILQSTSNASGQGGSLGHLRVLRLSRIFRILKIGKYNNGLRLIGRVLKNSTNALLLLLFFVVIASLLSGSLIYFAEQGNWNAKYGAYMRPDLLGRGGMERSPFYSIGRSLWWVVVTITGVGYGDYYPTTTLGKVIGVITTCSSVLLMALPITIIGNEFTEQYDIVAKEKKMKQLTTEASTPNLFKTIGLPAGGNEDSPLSRSSSHTAVSGNHGGAPNAAEDADSECFGGEDGQLRFGEDDDNFQSAQNDLGANDRASQSSCAWAAHCI